MADPISGLHDGSTKLRSLEDPYASPPPWDTGRPQPAFLALAKTGELRGRVLDAGCGTGEHALMAARLGLDATGIDLAPTALSTAMRKARQRGLTARFLPWDARLLADLTGPFDTMLDCGLFHIFGGHDRALNVRGLRPALRPGGRYFMLSFGNQQPGEHVPHRLTIDDITSAFTDGWQIGSIEPATIDTTASPHGIRAWLAAITPT